MLLRSNAAALGVFDRKTLHKIFSSIRVGDVFSITTNKELYDLLNDMHAVQRINMHVVLMEEDVPAKRGFHARISFGRIK